MATTDPVDGDSTPDIDDVMDELEQLEAVVDTREEREQVRETMRTLRRADRPRVFGRLRDTFDSRDAGEALVGSFVFGMPMIVEDGTFEIGRVIAANPPAFVLTVGFGFALVYGILHAAEFRRVREDLLYGVVPIRLVSIPFIAGAMAVTLMTMWGRVDWTEPGVALGQCAVTAVVMAVGASLGDVLPGS